MATRMVMIKEFCDMPGCGEDADTACVICGKDLCYEHSVSAVFRSFCPGCFKKARPAVEDFYAAQARTHCDLDDALTKIKEDAEAARDAADVGEEKDDGRE